MAKTKKVAKKAAPKKAAAKPAAPKPIKEALTKSGLVAHIAEASGVAAKDVRAVLAALEGAVHGSVSKKGAGAFTLPGLLKITAVSVAGQAEAQGHQPVHQGRAVVRRQAGFGEGQGASAEEAQGRRGLMPPGCGARNATASLPGSRAVRWGLPGRTP